MAKIGMQTGFSTSEGNGGGDFLPIDSGTYNAEVVWVKYREVHPEVMKYRDNKEDNMEFAFQFRITDGPHAKRVFFYDARPILNDSPSCRLRLILESLLQRNSLPEDFELDDSDLDKYSGLKCRIRVEKYVRTKGKNAGSEANRVTDVLVPLAGPVNFDDVAVTPPAPVAPVAPVNEDEPF